MSKILINSYLFADISFFTSSNVNFSNLFLLVFLKIRGIKMLDLNWWQTSYLSKNLVLIREPMAQIMPGYLTEYLNLFILLYEKEALLVDTGSGIKPLLPVVSSIIDKRKLYILTTHSHWDHVGNHYEFSDFPMYIHEDEVPELLKLEDLTYIRNDIESRYNSIAQSIPKPFMRSILNEKFIIKISKDQSLIIGGEELKIIELPGHTLGSIGLWYEKDKIFFTGDAFQTGFVYADSNPKEFLSSLDKIVSLLSEDLETTIYSSHEDLYLHLSDVLRLQEALEEALTNPSMTTRLTTTAIDLRVFTAGKFQILHPIFQEERTIVHKNIF